MTVQQIRPDVSDLVLRTYGRVLHPEMVKSQLGMTLTNDHLRLDIRLHASGHFLLLRANSQSMTELIIDHHEPLPEHNRLLDYRLRGCRTESADFPSGLRYDVSCQLERLNIDIFLRMHEELELDSARADLSARLPARNRLLPGAISLVRTEVCRDSILIHAFHTYPEHCAIVKTQSLFEVVL